ncbi:hypothetical protein L6259_02955 [Candidatus Parcubacteria bacterium]|nr:hypothetical protein [Candidatus Parcubacteria bacterium]
MKPLNKVTIEWSPNFAYAIGLIATDGCLSKDGRHINLTSKDMKIIEKFRDILKLENKIGRKAREKEKVKKYFYIQFGDKIFYQYLLSIGLTPAKSKTISSLKIPNEYFMDFFRGCIDGDGNISISKHPESQHPQLKVRLASASKFFLGWIKFNLSEIAKLNGGWIGKGTRIYMLSYGKADSVKLLKLLYYDNVESYLDRKYLIAKQFI